MKTVYKLLTDNTTIISKVIDILEPYVDPDANWKSDRYKYAYTILHKHLVSAAPQQYDTYIESWHHILFTTFSDGAHLRDSCSSIYPEISVKPKAQLLRNVFAVLVQHLSALNLIEYNIRIFPQFSLSPQLARSPLYLVLPEAVRFFSYVQSEARFKDNEALLDKEEYDALYSYTDLQELKTKSWNCSITAYRRFIFHNGINHFSEITAESIILYKAIVGKELNTALSFNPLVPLVSSLSGNDLTKIIGSPVSQQGTNTESDDEYRIVRGGEAFRLTGLKKSVVKRKKLKIKQIVIGNWSANKGDLKNFTTDSLSLLESPWIQTQKEYLEDKIFEKGTRKQSNRSFSLLNMYLFSYLDHFFKANKELPYPYPRKISDFYGFIYVKQSEILSQQAFKKSIKKIPVSLIKFIQEMLENNSTRSENNQIRDTVARLRRYFDWVRDRFGAIEEYRVIGNPITKGDVNGTGGTGYHLSNKVKIDLEYWMLLKEFLAVVSDQLLHDAETAQESVQTDSIEINKQISFAGHTVSVGTVKLDYFSKTSILNDEEKYIQVLPYQQFCALRLMANCGLRLSNTMWLDARTFDRLHNPNIEKVDATLFVNTDKAKEEPFTSTISIDVMEMAKRVRALRSRVRNASSTPMPYQENPRSKWGAIVPLFQYVKSNSYARIQTCLAQILREFEKCLLASEVIFDSVLFYAPAHIAGRDFKVLKNNNIDISDRRFKIVERDGDVEFTPIQIKSEVTPHSLRKTFATYISLIIGQDATGEIFTGQTPSTVGYYSEPSPEDELKISSTAAHIGLNAKAQKVYTSIERNTADQNTIIDKLMAEGIVGIQGYTLSTSVLDSDNIDSILKNASPDQIAINRTHICPFNNDCPSHIRDRLNQRKNCALCPVAISTLHDAPAISATIKYHCDRILEINSLLNSKSLTQREIESLSKERIEEVDFACSWLARYKFLNSKINDEQILVLDDGLTEIKHLKLNIPKDQTESLLARLHEVKGVPTLQSHQLKKSAERMSRKLLAALKSGELDLPEINEVDLALGLINKISTLYKLDNDQLNRLLQRNSLEKAKSTNDFFAALEAL